VRIKADICPGGVSFKLVAECEYEHAMLRFLASGAYEVRAVHTEASSWRPHDPTECTLHLMRPKPEQTA